MKFSKKINPKYNGLLKYMHLLMCYHNNASLTILYTTCRQSVYKFTHNNWFHYFIPLDARMLEMSTIDVVESQPIEVNGSNLIEKNENIFSQM